ncbi:MAG: hypothetical protein ACE5GQ_10655 [Nitrospinales bacterium]
MFAKLAEIARHRELIQFLVVKDLKIRYHGSVLGYFWSLLHPLLIMVLYTVVFSFFFEDQGGTLSPLFDLGAVAVEFLCRQLEPRNPFPSG